MDKQGNVELSIKGQELIKATVKGITIEFSDDDAKPENLEEGLVFAEHVLRGISAVFQEMAKDKVCLKYFLKQINMGDLKDIE